MLFSKKMNKTTTTLTLDAGLVASLKAKEINVSNLVNQFLKSVSEAPTEKSCKVLEKKISEKKAELTLLEIRLKEMLVLRDKERGGEICPLN